MLQRMPGVPVSSIAGVQSPIKSSYPPSTLISPSKSSYSQVHEKFTYKLICYHLARPSPLDYYTELAGDFYFATDTEGPKTNSTSSRAPNKPQYVQGAKSSSSPHTPGLLRFRSSEDEASRSGTDQLTTPEMLTQEQRHAQVTTTLFWTLF